MYVYMQYTNVLRIILFQFEIAVVFQSSPITLGLWFIDLYSKTGLIREFC